MNNFYRDVISKDPRFNSTDRIADLNLLEPVTRQGVEAIIADAKAHPYLQRGLEVDQNYYNTGGHDYGNNSESR